MTTTSQIPRLRRGVKLIVGMDDQPMLFDTDAGTYHRLGAAAASAPHTTPSEQMPAKASMARPSRERT